MSLPKQLRGNIMVNEHTRAVMALPYFYLLSSPFNLTTYIQYCRARQYVTHTIFKGLTPKNFNMRNTFIDVAAKHIKDLKTNRFLQNTFSTYKPQFQTALDMSNYTPAELICMGKQLVAVMDVVVPKEINRALGLAVDLADTTLLNDFDGGAVGVLSPTTITILSYFGDISDTVDIITILFPEWSEAVGKTELNDFITKITISK